MAGRSLASFPPQGAGSGSGGGETLAQTLALGNMTGGVDLDVTTGDAVTGVVELTLDAAAEVDIGGTTATSVVVGHAGIETSIVGDVALTEQAASATPAAGKVAVYAKADGLVYSKDDAGTETLMSGGGGRTLAQTLAIGALTGGTDVTLTTGDSLLGAAELSLASAAGSPVSIGPAAGAGAGGTVTVKGGESTSSLSSGSVSISGGDNSGTGAPGSVSIGGGTSTSAGGGSVTISGSSATGTNFAGGGVQLNAGASNGSGTGPVAYLTAGNSTSGAGGIARVLAGSSSSGVGGQLLLQAGGSTSGTGGAVNLTSGAANSGQTKGAITIDSGTGLGTGGAISIGTAQAASVDIGRTGIKTTVTGDVSLVEQAASATPSTGEVAVYAKADGLVYSKDDAGTETLMSGGGPPTTTAWSANAETITATKTLIDADATVQILKAATAQDVVLPTLSTSTPYFVIINDAGGSADLTIKNSSGSAVATIAPGEGVRLFTDGSTKAYVDSLALSPAALSGHAVYSWGASVLVANYYPYANDAALSWGGSASNNYYTKQTVEEAGTVVAATIHTSATGAQIKVYKNGALDTTLATTTATVEVQTMSTTVAAGDTISVQSVVSTGGSGRIDLDVDVTAGARIRLPWGGNVTVTTYGPAANEIASGGAYPVSSQPYRLEHVIPSSCTAKSLGWGSSSATSATQMDIYKNGASSETITLSGAQGASSSPTTSFAAADRVAIVHSASTAPGLSAWGLTLDIAARVLSFGGSLSTSTTNFYYSMGNTSASGATAMDRTTQAAIARACTLSTLAIRVQTAHASETIEVWKNGALSGSAETLANSIAQVLTLSTNHSFAATDLLAIKNTGVTNTGETALDAIMIEAK